MYWLNFWYVCIYILVHLPWRNTMYTNNESQCHNLECKISYWWPSYLSISPIHHLKLYHGIFAFSYFFEITNDAQSRFTNPNGSGILNCHWIHSYQTVSMHNWVSNLIMRDKNLDFNFEYIILILVLNIFQFEILNILFQFEILNILFQFEIWNILFQFEIWNILLEFEIMNILLEFVIMNIWS